MLFKKLSRLAVGNRKQSDLKLKSPLLSWSLHPLSYELLRVTYWGCWMVSVTQIVTVGHFWSTDITICFVIQEKGKQSYNLSFNFLQSLMERKSQSTPWRAAVLRRMFSFSCCHGSREDYALVYKIWGDLDVNQWETIIHLWPHIYEAIIHTRMWLPGRWYHVTRTHGSHEPTTSAPSSWFIQPWSDSLCRSGFVALLSSRIASFSSFFSLCSSWTLSFSNLIK